MKVEHQVVRRGLLGRSIVEVDALLVVALHEVDLHSGHTPILEQGECVVHLLFDRRGPCPNPGLHIFRCGVSDHFGNVDSTVHPEDVVLGRPAGVDQHVLEAGLRGEVRIIFHGRGSERAFSVGAKTAAPPIPRSAAWLDPRGVLDRRRRVQAGDDVGLDQLCRLSCHHQHPPRGMMRQPADNGSLGIVQMRRKTGLEPVAGPACRRIHQIHSGVVSQVGFRNGHPRHTRHFHQERKPNQHGAPDAALIGKTARRELQKLAFVHGPVVRQDQRIDKRILADAKLGALPHEPEFGESRLLRNQVAECNGVIISAGLDHQLAPCVLLALHAESIEVISDCICLSRHQSIRLIGLRGHAVHQAHVLAERRRAFQRQPQRGGLDQRFALKRDGVHKLAPCWSRLGARG